MSQLVEDALTSKLAAWIDANRPEGFPTVEALPVHVAGRDEMRTRPCLVLETSEARTVPAMPGTCRVKLDVHLFTQVDDTPAALHATWAGTLETMFRDSDAIIAALASETFLLHALLPRESATVPDEVRGRESVLSFEAVVTAG